MSKLSFLQNLGLKLLGVEALAKIKGEVAESTKQETERAVLRRSVSELVPSGKIEEIIQHAIDTRAGHGANQITSALLRNLVGSTDAAYLVTAAAADAENSGEGFMKKKAAVLRKVREVSPGLPKSVEQLIIELAVQMLKD